CIVGPGARVQEFTLDDIRASPRVDMTTELKCIEGWSIKRGLGWGPGLPSSLAQIPAGHRQRPVSPYYVGVVTPGRRILRGPGSVQRRAPPNAAVLRNERPAPWRRAPRRAAAPGHAASGTASSTSSASAPLRLWTSADRLISGPSRAHDWDSGH
ncbi:MAG: hypothetical protein WKG07_18775, partial [Hymenobacter sp.]